MNLLLVTRVRTSDFASLAVTGTENLGGQEAYVVSAVRKDGSAEDLWFSKADGLLLRWTYYHQTLFGPEQHDLSAYKPPAVRDCSPSSIGPISMTSISAC